MRGGEGRRANLDNAVREGVVVLDGDGRRTLQTDVDGEDVGWVVRSSGLRLSTRKRAGKGEMEWKERGRTATL
jgi:hypothetical protein